PVSLRVAPHRAATTLRFALPIAADPPFQFSTFGYQLRCPGAPGGRLEALRLCYPLTRFPVRTPLLPRVQTTRKPRPQPLTTDNEPKLPPRSIRRQRARRQPRRRQTCSPSPPDSPPRPDRVPPRSSPSPAVAP